MAVFKDYLIINKIKYLNKTILLYFLVPIDGQKKIQKKVSLPDSFQTTQAFEEEEEEEGEEIDEEEEGSDSEYVNEYGSRSDTEEDISENEIDAEDSLVEALKKTNKKEVKRPANEKRKRKPAVQSTVREKRAKTDEQVERTHPPIKPSSSKKIEGASKMPSEDADSEKKKDEKDLPAFSDKNCDYDLFNSAPTNVVCRRIKVANNMIISCRMINQETKNNSYEYAALVFERRTSKDKKFEFNMPLSLIKNVIEALKIIVNENPKFFGSN